MYCDLWRKSTDLSYEPRLLSVRLRYSKHCWCPTLITRNILHQSRNLFSYVRVIQNHPPTPVRNSKYLAIPPTPLPLRNIRMAPHWNWTDSMKWANIFKQNYFFSKFRNSQVRLCLNSSVLLWIDWNDYGIILHLVKEIQNLLDFNPVLLNKMDFSQIKVRFIGIIYKFSSVARWCRWILLNTYSSGADWCYK